MSDKQASKRMHLIKGTLGVPSTAILQEKFGNIEIYHIKYGRTTDTAFRFL